MPSSEALRKRREVSVSIDILPSVRLALNEAMVTAVRAANRWRLTSFLKAAGPYGSVPVVSRKRKDVRREKNVLCDSQSLGEFLELYRVSSCHVWRVVNIERNLSAISPTRGIRF